MYSSYVNKSQNFSDRNQFTPIMLKISINFYEDGYFQQSNNIPYNHS